MIQFGDKIISFDLIYQDRKTLGIKVNPDRSVQVRAPLNTSNEKIIETVKKRAAWILKQQSFFLAFEPLTPPRKYVNGETHLYLGRQYRLKIIKADKNRVKLYGKYFYVLTPHYEPEHVQELLEEWYKKHAINKLNEYSQYWLEIFKKKNTVPTKIEIKKMTKRWGSCSPKGNILLNSELIKAPKGCIDYVIIHELCHLVHPNHNQAFFNLLSSYMPDWQIWKDRLERFLS